jgi:hypothetical protein
LPECYQGYNGSILVVPDEVDWMQRGCPSAVVRAHDSLVDAYQQTNQRRREDIMEIGSSGLGRNENEIADVSLSGSDNKFSKHPRRYLGGLGFQHAEKISG